MERRKFIIGLGALATGSAAATGTGALSSMVAEDRTVSVDVVDDSQAYVGISPYTEQEDDDTGEIYSSFTGELAGNSVFAAGSDEAYMGDFDGGDDKLELNFAEENQYHPWGGEGVNPDSQYNFDDVFQIANLGQELGSIEVWIERSEELREGTEVSFYATGGNSDYSGSLVGEGNAQDLNNSEWVDVGVEIDAEDETVEIEGSVEIHAKRV